MSRKGHPNELHYVFVDDVSLNPSAPAVTGDLVNVAMWFWDTNALSWVKATGGSATGADVNVTNFPATQPVSVADGADVAEGSTADVAGTPTTIGLLKQIASASPGGAGAGSVNVLGTVSVVVTGQPIAVTGAGGGAGSVNVINNVTTIISGTPTVLQGGAPWQVAGSMAVTQGGVWNVGITGQPISVTSAPSDTPTSTFVAGTVTALLGAGTNTLGSFNISSGIQGVIATGEPFTAKPLPNGGRVMWTEPAQADDGDIIAMAVDKLGKQIGYPFAPRQLSVQMGSTTSGTGETTFITAGSAGVFHDLAYLTLANLGSLSRPTVTIRDRTAGPVIFRHTLGNFEIVVIPFSRPWEQQVAESPWTMQLSIAGGSVFVAGQVVKLI